MPKIIIDNKEVECRDGVSVLQAALDVGKDIPHYCYHPGLSVVASCRLCLMEMKMPHPKTREMDWAPKLMPACQTPVRDGMEVRFESDTVQKARADCMEFFLINHPLDCPVCDQAGECYLQDYSYKFGNAESRMVDAKQVNPKKDIGPKTLLYADRCVMCTRCIRFTDEISGTHELGKVNRGSRTEIDVFPGFPLDNPLQGNVVDLCPVGCLLDKDFLFKQRVWLLNQAESVCPGCSTGCSIIVDHNEGVVQRIKPRYNPDVNEWWICDEGRFGHKYVHDKGRIAAPVLRRGKDKTTPDWDTLTGVLRYRLEECAKQHGDAKMAAVLSPFMACEEAWLLIRLIRELAPGATLAMGPVPTDGEEQTFPVGAKGDDVRFVIRAEKCPNRRGIEMLIEAAGGPTATYDEFVEKAGAGEFAGAWIAAGYPTPWIDKKQAKFAEKIGLLVVSDMFENDLTAAATAVLPACAWVERSGSFVSAGGAIQPFDRAIAPPDLARTDGQYLYQLAGFDGLYSAERVRELIAKELPAFSKLAEAPPVATFAH